MALSSAHTEQTLQYTRTRETTIQMPMLGEETHLAAFLVLDHDTPTEMINEVLEKVYNESGVYHLWLADDKPDSLPDDHDRASVPPIRSTWQSSFAGQSIEQAFEFLSTLPVDTDVSINRTYIVVLDPQLYKTRGWVVVCKIDENGTITTVPCAAKNPILHIDSYSWHLWPQYLERWRGEGRPFLR